MLIEFYGKNFGCFRDEFRLSMLATEIDPDIDRGVIEIQVDGDPEPLRLLRAAAIYGPNASGKSTVLRAANTLRRLIAESVRSRSDAVIRGYEPFAVTANTESPVTLGIKAVIEGNVYDYEVVFGHRRFHSERLERLTLDKSVTFFQRTEQEVVGEWKSDDTFVLLTKDFGPNKLLLSLADRLTPSLARGIAVGLRRLLATFDGSSPIWYLDGRPEAIAKRVRQDNQFSGWLLSQLVAADVGVTDLRAEERRTVRRVEPGESVEGDESEADAVEEISYRLSLMHRGDDGIFPIPFHRESLGTQRMIDLAPLIYDLTRGEIKAAFADEMDSSLHPELLKGIIRHFNCEVSKQDARGQLIFVTHETALLDDEARDAILRRDQVYLTEKSSSGAARLYSIADFKERNVVNLRKRYLQGRYGAIPSLGQFPR